MQSFSHLLLCDIMASMRYRLGPGLVPSSAYSVAQSAGFSRCEPVIEVSEALVVYAEDDTDSHIVGVLSSPEHLPRLLRSSDTPQLVTRAEIASLLNVGVRTVDKWRERYPSFPEPAKITPTGSPIWLWADILEWNARERPYGRHIPKPVEATNL